MRLIYQGIEYSMYCAIKALNTLCPALSSVFKHEYKVIMMCPVPMRHVLAFSLVSPPPSDPGRCGHLRCILCALGQVITPLDGLGAGARSRRNLACI